MTKKNDGTKVTKRNTRAKVTKKEMDATLNAASGINAPEMGVNTNGNTDNIGVSVGSSLSLATDHANIGVSGDISNKVSGHNNATSQIESRLQENEREKTEKEERLYNKVVNHFSAPVFDADKRKAELISNYVLSGKALTGDVISTVDDIVGEEKKKFTIDNPAPVCNAALVLGVIRENYDKEFASIVGCSANDIKPEDVRVYSRSLGVLLSSSLPASATAAAVVRAVLSYKHLINDRLAKAKLSRKDNDTYYTGIRGAVRSGIELHRSLDQIIKDVTYNYNRFVEDDNRETKQLISNYYKIREKIDSLAIAISAACPALVDVIGGSYIVHLERVKKVSVPAYVHTEYITKYRSSVADLTRINAALFGVTNNF